MRDGPRLLRHRDRASKPRLSSPGAPLWRRGTSLLSPGKPWSAHRRPCHTSERTDGLPTGNPYLDLSTSARLPCQPLVSGLLFFPLFLFLLRRFLNVLAVCQATPDWLSVAGQVVCGLNCIIKEGGKEGGKKKKKKLPLRVLVWQHFSSS